LRFYDPGEDDKPASMSVKMPDGTIPNCTWEATNEAGTVTASGSGACTIQTSTLSGARFNGEWVTVEIVIPSGYTCTDCWWWMDITLSQPHDRTVWMAGVLGNPVRLVPNS
jgi:hypothetical protein